MKYAVLLVILAATPAFADDKPVCVDASRDTSYNAQPISLHEVLVRNALGSDKRSLRLGTTCIHVDRTARVAVHSLAGCFFYGAFVAKVLLVQTRRLPGWVLPAAGGTLAVVVAVLCVPRRCGTTTATSFRTSRLPGYRRRRPPIATGCDRHKYSNTGEQEQR